MKITNKSLLEISKIILELLSKDSTGKYDFEIKNHKEKRTKDANSYFHLLINKLARKINVSDEEMKIKMVLNYGTVATENGQAMGAKVPKGSDIAKFYPYSRWYKEDEDCDYYVFYERTHLLNNKEMSKLIDGLVYECKQLGIETLTPRELSLLKETWNEKN